MDQATRELDVECLPNAIPEEFAVDVSKLEIGDSIHVRDLEVPEGIEILNDPDVAVVSVVAPAVAEAETPAEAAAEGAAPEGAVPGASDESAEQKSDD
jgi:large subunit ribosomal protein L25